MHIAVVVQILVKSFAPSSIHECNPGLLRTQCSILLTPFPSKSTMAIDTTLALAMTMVHEAREKSRHIFRQKGNADAAIGEFL